MKMKVDFRELKQLQKQIEQAEKNFNKTIEKIVNDIADEFLAEVKAKTPSSDSNKLKENWKKRIVSNGSGYTVEIYNDLEYASSVEYGHKINDGKGWKQGHFMMTITENDIKNRMDKIAQPTIDDMLRGIFK